MYRKCFCMDIAMKMPNWTKVKIQNIPAQPEIPLAPSLPAPSWPLL